jgi:hypothetical protein
VRVWASVARPPSPGHRRPAPWSGSRFRGPSACTAWILSALVASGSKVSPTNDFDSARWKRRFDPRKPCRVLQPRQTRDDRAGLRSPRIGPDHFLEFAGLHTESHTQPVGKPDAPIRRSGIRVLPSPSVLDHPAGTSERVTPERTPPRVLFNGYTHLGELRGNHKLPRTR